MRNWIVTILLAAGTAAAQTQIDLRTQAKSVDFSAASSTKPLKTGAALPATCGVGEVFFNTTAPSGANLYACTAVNTWTAQGSSGAATLVMENGGSLVGSRNALNVIPGSGLTSIMTDTGAQINFQVGLDSAVIETQPNEQSGAALLCQSNGGAISNFRCAMHPTAGAYVYGMLVHWVPDVNGAGGTTTLNIDNLGPAAVKMTDGVTDPTMTDIVGGRMYSVWYDGARFRMAASQASFSYTPENTANKGQASGYAALDGAGKVPAAQLPATTPMAFQSASLTFAPLFDGACADQTFSFSGVSSSTQLAPGLPANLPVGVDAILFVNAPDSVTARLCNHSGGTQTLGTYTFNSRTPSYTLTASAPLSFGTIADGGCGSHSFALSGAIPGDAVAAGFPAGLTAGITGSMAVGSNSTINVLLCNYSGTAWSPAPQTFAATIVK